MNNMQQIILLDKVPYEQLENISFLFEFLEEYIRNYRFPKEEEGYDYILLHTFTGVPKLHPVSRKDERVAGAVYIRPPENGDEYIRLYKWSLSAGLVEYARFTKMNLIAINYLIKLIIHRLKEVNIKGLPSGFYVRASSVSSANLVQTAQEPNIPDIEYIESDYPYWFRIKIKENGK